METCETRTVVDDLRLGSGIRLLKAWGCELRKLGARAQKILSLRFQKSVRNTSGMALVRLLGMTQLGRVLNIKEMVLFDFVISYDSFLLFICLIAP